MKKLLSIIVLITQLMPFAKGQEFAFAHSNTTPEYASANSGYDVILSHTTVHKQIHPLIVTGGILASYPVPFTTVVRFCYYYTAFDTYSGGVGTHLISKYSRERRGGGDNDGGGYNSDCRLYIYDYRKTQSNKRLFLEVDYSQAQ